MFASTESGASFGCVNFVEAGVRHQGVQVERLPGRDGYGDILTARLPWGGDGAGGQTDCL